MDVKTQSIPVCNVVLYLLISFIIYFPTMTLKQITDDSEIHKILLYPARIKCFSGDTSEEKLFVWISWVLGGFLITEYLTLEGTCENIKTGTFSTGISTIIKTENKLFRWKGNKGFLWFFRMFFHYLHAKQLNENINGYEKINENFWKELMK